jgi:hypothetical protein
MMTLVANAWINGGNLNDPIVVNNMCGMVLYTTASKIILYLYANEGLVIPDDILEILNKVVLQITTLVPELRTEVQEEKLQPKDFLKLQKFIDDNIS